MQMGTPLGQAKLGTFEDFLKVYQGGGVDPTSLLLSAISNHSVPDRIAIAEKLLEDGADASVVEGEDRVNCLHVLFGGPREDHDFEAEAVLLRRLLEGGADINLWSPRFGYPLQVLVGVPISDEKLVPWYDVIFSRPELDLDVKIMKGKDYTLRDLLLKNKKRTARIHYVEEFDRRKRSV